MNQTRVLIVNAIHKHMTDHETFRNKHICESTGLDKQTVNYHLKKFESQGLIARNPLKTVEFLVPDIMMLIGTVIPEEEDNLSVHHMGKMQLLDIEKSESFKQWTDTYAALRAFGITNKPIREGLETELKLTIKQLQQELHYMHARRMSKKVAIRILRENNERKHLADYSIDINKLDEPATINLENATPPPAEEYTPAPVRPDTMRERVGRMDYAQQKAELDKRLADAEEDSSLWDDEEWDEETEYYRELVEIHEATLADIEARQNGTEFKFPEVAEE